MNTNFACIRFIWLYEKKILKKKTVEKFSPIFFSIFSESFDTYADPSLNAITAKLNISSQLFVEKSVQKIKILSNEKIKIVIFFLHTFRNIPHLLGATIQFCSVWGWAGRGGGWRICISLTRKDPRKCHQNQSKTLFLLWFWWYFLGFFSR